MNLDLTMRFKTHSLKNILTLKLSRRTQFKVATKKQCMNIHLLLSEATNKTKYKKTLSLKEFKYK